MEVGTLQLTKYIDRVVRKFSKAPFVICDKSRELPWISTYAWFMPDLLEPPTEFPKADDRLFFAVINLSSTQQQVDINFSTQRRKITFPHLRENGSYREVLPALPVMKGVTVPIYKESIIAISNVNSAFDVIDFRFAYRDPFTNGVAAHTAHALVVRFDNPN